MSAIDYAMIEYIKTEKGEFIDRFLYFVEISEGNGATVDIVAGWDMASDENAKKCPRLAFSNAVKRAWIQELLNKKEIYIKDNCFYLGGGKNDEN